MITQLHNKLTANMKCISNDA